MKSSAFHYKLIRTEFNSLIWGWKTKDRCGFDYLYIYICYTTGHCFPFTINRGTVPVSRLRNPKFKLSVYFELEEYDTVRILWIMWSSKFTQMFYSQARGCQDDNHSHDLYSNINRSFQVSYRA